MIRIILDEIDGEFVLDVLDTRKPVGINITRHADYVDAASAAVTAVAGWHNCADTATHAPLPTFLTQPPVAQPPAEPDNQPLVPQWLTAITAAATALLLALILANI